jgi:cytidine deaminase
MEKNSTTSLTEIESALIVTAKNACSTAYAPYSNFKVGAAVLMADGRVFCGSNQENAAYSACLCAERVALLYACANANNSYPIAIAIAAWKNGDFIETPITPCGECCQVLIEMQARFKHTIKVLLYGKQETRVLKSASLLLPYSFTNQQLNA